MSKTRERSEVLVTVKSDDYGRVKIPQKVKELLNIEGNRFEVDFVLGESYIILKKASGGFLQGLQHPF